jgi:DNA-binding LacI/PurR family transcriptional regulator
MKKSKKVTIREVAKRAGVSVTTVSRVLNGDDLAHMRPETRQRVQLAISELEYTPAKAARTLRRQRTQVIGILIPDISNSFFSRVVRGIGAITFKKEFSTLVCDSNHSVEQESRYLDTLLAEGVEGIVFIPVGVPDMKRVNRLLRQGIRIVVADRRVEGLPAVEADNLGGSRELTRHLLNLGYRRIAYISGPQEVSTAKARLTGFQETAAEEGLTPVVIEHGKFTYESGYELAQQILKKYRVDAIMAGNDLMAIGVIQAAEDLGFHVPEDLGVTGFDHTPLLSLVRPKLTTVEVPAHRLGEEVARQLFDGQGEDLTLPVQLIPGETCRQQG